MNALAEREILGGLLIGFPNCQKKVLVVVRKNARLGGVSTLFSSRSVVVLTSHT